MRWVRGACGLAMLAACGVRVRMKEATRGGGGLCREEGEVRECERRLLEQQKRPHAHTDTTQYSVYFCCTQYGVLTHSAAQHTAAVAALRHTHTTHHTTPHHTPHTSHHTPALHHHRLTPPFTCRHARNPLACCASAPASCLAALCVVPLSHAPRLRRATVEMSPASAASPSSSATASLFNYLQSLSPASFLAAVEAMTAAPSPSASTTPSSSSSSAAPSSVRPVKRRKKEYEEEERGGDSSKAEGAEELRRSGRSAAAATLLAGRGAAPQCSLLWSVDGVRAAVSACVQLSRRPPTGGARAGAAALCAEYVRSLHALLCTGGVSSSGCAELFPLILDCLLQQPQLAVAFVLHVHDLDEGQLVELLAAALDQRHAQIQSDARRSAGQQSGADTSMHSQLDVDPLLSASPQPTTHRIATSSRASPPPRCVHCCAASPAVPVLCCDVLCACACVLAAAATRC